MSGLKNAPPEIAGKEKGIWTTAAERSEKAGLRHAKVLRLVNNGEVKEAGALAVSAARVNTSASAGLGSDIRSGGFAQIGAIHRCRAWAHVSSQGLRLLSAGGREVHDLRVSSSGATLFLC